MSKQFYTWLQKIVSFSIIFSVGIKKIYEGHNNDMIIRSAEEDHVYQNCNDGFYVYL